MRKSAFTYLFFSAINDQDMGVLFKQCLINRNTTLNCFTWPTQGILLILTRCNFLVNRCHSAVNHTGFHQGLTFTFHTVSYQTTDRHNEKWKFSYKQTVNFQLEYITEKHRENHLIQYKLTWLLQLNHSSALSLASHMSERFALEQNLVHFNWYVSVPLQLPL